MTGLCLVLRLAGPVQSWGGRSQFNRRETMAEPTKSGLIGLLAAAQGRRRTDPIEDLLHLTLGVRTDQPGTLLRDYHTVSDYRGRPLPSASVTAKGLQKPTAPAKYTHVTERYYLQDAVFVAAVSGPEAVLATLAGAVREPAFPLALGRRSCPPTQPLLLTPEGHTGPLWPGSVLDVLAAVPWAAGPAQRARFVGIKPRPRTIDLPVTLDDPQGEDTRADLPSTFDPRNREFRSRRVHQTWVHVPPRFDPADGDPETEAGADTEASAAAVTPHDPFALLGW